MDTLKLYSAAFKIFLTTLLFGTASAQTNDENEAWQRAQGADSIAAYQSFIRAFPDSSHLGDAFQRLVCLKLAATRSEFFPQGSAGCGSVVARDVGSAQQGVY